MRKNSCGECIGSPLISRSLTFSTIGTCDYCQKQAPTTSLGNIVECVTKLIEKDWSLCIENGVSVDTHDLIMEGYFNETESSNEALKLDIINKLPTVFWYRLAKPE